MNEKKNLELYNFLIKELSIIQLYKIEENNTKKDELIKKLEKELMNELNYFENVNFSRINFFHKDYYPSPALRIVMLLSDDETNYFLFKNEKNQFEVVNSLIDINYKIEEKINEILKENDLKSKNKPKLVAIKYRECLKNKNTFYSLPEYLLIFKLKIDKIKAERFIAFKKEEILNFDESILKGVINTLDLKEIIKSIDDKNKLIID